MSRGAPPTAAAGVPAGVVAVVGRPNVGKSTLVNRLVGRREAIVEERPGVTRDRKELVAEWRGRRFRVVDTGGWVAGDEPLETQVRAQAERAVAVADVILMVVDVTVGITQEDADVARVLHRTGRPVILVANKVDDERRETDAWVFRRLGLGDPQPVSAIHGRGTGDLLDRIVGALGPPPAEPEPEAGPAGPAGFAVAIVGRPNVGKSTLFNRLVGEERTIVHDRPGTTRDAIDTVVETPDGPVRFVDTAGMRRRARIDERTEHVAVLRSLAAVDRADAALLVIDAASGVTHQDQRLAERIDAAGCATVVVLNKWDLVTDTEQRAAVLAGVRDRLGFLEYAPVLRVSARTGRGVGRILPALREAEAAYRRRVPTAALNRVIAAAQQRHPPPAPPRGRRPRILYATQGATDPPTFTLFTNRPLPRPYLRYLERCLREDLALGPTPIKLRVRARSGAS